jgi:hypothetical protein
MNRNLKDEIDFFATLNIIIAKITTRNVYAINDTVINEFLNYPHLNIAVFWFVAPVV